MKKFLKCFSKREILLWISSVMIIVISFFAFSQDNIINLFASVIGISAVFINARGNPVGQVLMIIFSLLYGIISCRCAYYGEMITYLFMTAPMAAVALVSWINNPYGDGGVEVNTVSPPEVAFMFVLGGIVTSAFYFILKYFETANLIASTFSILTSFIGAYLSFRRSAFFSLAYIFNDIVLIILWGMASAENTAHISVMACFFMFFVHDVYGFVSWREMEIRQFLDHMKKFEKSLDSFKKL